MQERLRAQQAGHGIDHVLRVWNNAKKLHAEVGGNQLVIELAALLHDLGDAKFNDGIEMAAQFASDILMRLGVPQDVIDHVVHIVDNISFRKVADAEVLSLEGKIVQDADRIDALGAIGIVRTIEYGAAVGQPFHFDSKAVQTEIAIPTGIQHFHDKLFKLYDKLNTEPARRIAKERESFMRTFVKQYLSECGESDG